MNFVGKLPSEIWIQIASLLRDDDLTRLAQTCRFLLTISRTLLYRFVSLRDISSTSCVVETLRLLASDPKLTKCVRHLYVCHQDLGGQELESVQLMVDALANATSLSSLSVGSCFFQTVSQQERFVDYTRNRTSPLTYISYFGQPLPSGSFGISHLRHIEWYTRTGPALWSLLHASRDSVEILKIDLVYILPDIDTAPLWEMRFPNLHSIEIGDAVVEDIFERNSTSNFFRVHALDHKLDYAELYQRFHGTCGFLLNNSSDKSSSISREALQDRPFNIYGLKGEPSFIVQMAHRRMLQVKTVIEIAISFYREDLAEIFPQFDIMIGRLASKNIFPPAFPRLRNIYLDLEAFSQNWRFQTTLKEKCLRMIERAAELWGDHLTHWTAVFPPFDISAEELGDAFNEFRRLNVIHLLLQTMGGLEKMEEYAVELAKKCANLNTVCVAAEELYPGNFYILEVIRKKDGVFINNCNVKKIDAPLHRNNHYTPWGEPVSFSSWA